MTNPINTFLERQLRKFPQIEGNSENSQFLALVAETYDDHDRNLRRLERAMSLMNDELQDHMQRRETLVQSLQKRTTQFEATLHGIRQGLALADAEGLLLIGNDRFPSMLGFQSFDDIKNTDLCACFERAPVFSPGTGQGKALHQDELKLFAKSSNPEILHIKTNKNRTLELEKIHDADQGFVIAIQDITESVLSEKLERVANQDALTGLASRHAFNAAIEASKQSMQMGDRVTLFCMDLDRFKTVNDTMGHAFGDELLKQVAGRISASIEEPATVARLGGDEFAILVSNSRGEGEAIRLAKAIISAIRQPFEIENQTIRTGVSIGVAQSPEHGRDAGLLLRRADIALYKAKAVGGNAFRIFSHEMEAKLTERTQLEKDLRSALANDELVLHYQPIICARTQSISGFEALVRWQHPKLGLVPPDKFIPVAEETGLINAIGRWVLHAATQEAVRWPDRYSVSVNLSAIQFSDRNLVQDVVDCLAVTGLQAERLHLEITESVLMEQSEFTAAILEGLNSSGVSINLDDFGAGYSSFNYILEFGFQRVKIDKVFLQDKYDGKKAHAILTAISGFCRDLGIETVAEGVETHAHVEMLEEIDVDAFQGYYFSRPVDAKAARRLIASAELTESRSRVA